MTMANLIEKLRADLEAARTEIMMLRLMVPTDEPKEASDGF